VEHKEPLAPNPHVKAFADAVRWSDYTSAVFAIAAVERDNALINLLTQITLLQQQSPPESWGAETRVDELRLIRGYWPVQRVKDLVTVPDLPRSLVESLDLHLSVNEMDYHWGFQDYYPNIRAETGWPGLRLAGRGQLMFQVCGREDMRRLERRLPGAHGGALSNWDSVAQFLTLDGSRVPFGDSVQSEFNIVARAPVRFIVTQLAAHGELRVKVQCSRVKWPTDARVLVCDTEGVTLRTEDRPEERSEEPDVWTFAREVGSSMPALDLSLYADGVVVERQRVHRAGTTTERPNGTGRAKKSAQIQSHETDGVFQTFLSRLHPAIVEKAGPLFLNGHLDDAILNALKAVEVSLRERGKMMPEDIGTKLVDNVLRQLTLGETQAETDSLRQLFKGALGWLKNPQSHRFVGVANPVVGIEVLAMASYLLRTLDAARDREAPSDR